MSTPSAQSLFTTLNGFQGLGLSLRTGLDLGIRTQTPTKLGCEVPIYKQVGCPSFQLVGTRGWMS